MLLALWNTSLADLNNIMCPWALIFDWRQNLCWVCEIFAEVWHPGLEVQHRKPYHPYSRKVVSGASQVCSCRPSCFPATQWSLIPKTCTRWADSYIYIAIYNIAYTGIINAALRGHASAGQVCLLLKFCVFQMTPDSLPHMALALFDCGQSSQLS